MSKTLLCYGDSNTYGYDPREPFGGRLPEGERWPERLAALLPGCEILADGLNGREIPKSEFALELFGRRLDKCPRPDALLLCLGANDLLNSSRPSTATVAANIEKLVNAILARPDFADPRRLVLLTPPAFRLADCGLAGEVLNSASRCFGVAFKPMAERTGIRLIDTGRWELPLAFDGVHLSPEGHRLFAEQLAKVLADTI